MLQGPVDLELQLLEVERLQDVVEGIRVADAMSHIDFIMSMFLPSDVPVAREVRQMEIMLNHSAKPICFVTYEWEGTPEITMMRSACGTGRLRLYT